MILFKYFFTAKTLYYIIYLLYYNLYIYEIFMPCSLYCIIRNICGYTFMSNIFI